MYGPNSPRWCAQLQTVKKHDITSENVIYTVLHTKILIIAEKYVHISGWINYLFIPILA